MGAPPDVLFHRYFSTLSTVRRQTYRGKHDIREPEFDRSIVSLLLGIQEMMNAALAAEKDMPDHVPHDPFHFDYIDADDPNALAFCYEGYSFIGITVPFVKQCLDVAHTLAASLDITRLVGIHPEKHNTDGVIAAFTRLQLNSIIAHEWAHHVHGHVPKADGDALFDEFAVSEGTLDQQARELDADGYSAYLVLSNLFDSAERTSILQHIGCQTKPANEQDESLFGLFVCALEGQLSSRPFRPIHEHSVYERSHPPPALRMNSIIQHANGWCEQNRPKLLEGVSMRNLGAFMSAVGQVTWPMNGGTSWDEDVRFLRSPAGQRYANLLNTRVNALKEELEVRARAAHRDLPSRL